MPVVTYAETNLDQLHLSVVSNPSTGYYWEISDTTHGVELINQKWVANHPGALGGSGIEHYSFRILSDDYNVRIVEINARNQLPTGKFIDDSMLNNSDDPIEPESFIQSTKPVQNKLKTFENGKIRVSFQSVQIDGVTGYQIWRSTNKNFSKNVKKYSIIIQDSNRDATALTLTNAKNLKKGTKYYYKVRAKITMADGTGKYTAWSNIRYAKCKKTIK